MCALFNHFSTCLVATPSLSIWRRHFLRIVTVIVYCNVEVSHLGAFNWFLAWGQSRLKGWKVYRILWRYIMQAHGVCNCIAVCILLWLWFWPYYCEHNYVIINMLVIILLNVKYQYLCTCVLGLFCVCVYEQWKR